MTRKANPSRASKNGTKPSGSRQPLVDSHRAGPQAGSRNKSQARATITSPPDIALAAATPVAEKRSEDNAVSNVSAGVHVAIPPATRVPVIPPATTARRAATAAGSNKDEANSAAARTTAGRTAADAAAMGAAAAGVAAEGAVTAAIAALAATADAAATPTVPAGTATLLAVGASGTTVISDSDVSPEILGDTTPRSSTPANHADIENSTPVTSFDPPVADLPPFTSSTRVPTRSINGISGPEFVSIIDDIYNRILKWKKNLFKVPSGNASKKFVTILAEWLAYYNTDSEFKGIALKVFHVLPALLLQKPSKNSKARDHLRCLEKRLVMWDSGDITALLSEARTIQERFKTSVGSKRRTTDDVARIFARLMLQGKVNAALKFLSEENGGGVHKVTDEIMDELQKKHPKPAPISEGSLLFGPVNHVPANYFDEIDEQAIFKAAQLTKGAGGPSHLDAEQYRTILTSNKMKVESKFLREQIALLARKLASEIVDPATLEALIGCRLIPLDKKPGVRPIGIGEVLRRIIGKAIGWVLKQDLMEATGPLQAASGFQGGAEAAIHAMRQVFEDDDTEAVILVDATNAFNLLNRQTALHNVQRTCPPFAKILINTYRSGTRLSVGECREIASLEGTTQGDNIGGHFYNQGTIPLQNILHISSPEIKQVWLADDATGAGTLANLLAWWNTIIEHGRKFGYFVNEAKSWLIIKNEEDHESAQRIFTDSGIQITTSGKRHLGAAIGSNEFRVEYSKKKIAKWQAEVEKLAEIAKTEPQAAYAAYIHGEQHRFSYFLRTIPGMSDLLEPLDRAITERLIPAMLGRQSISETERSMYALPIRNGGLGIPVVGEIAQNEFETSLQVTAPLATIMALQSIDLPDISQVAECRSTMRTQKAACEKENTEAVEQSLSPPTLRALIQAQEKGASSWLSAMPLKDLGFNLNKGEFHDAIAIRYNSPLQSLPSMCPCGHRFNLDHALNCKRGGFVIMRHNNVRDFEANLLAQVCTDVEKEPPLQPLTGETITGAAQDGAKPDVRARGFWRPAQNAFFDVRLTNLNAQSQAHLSTKQIFAKHEAEKKRMYNDRIMNVEHGTFTPLVFSLNGVMSPECKLYHKYLAQTIAAKTEQRYSSVITLIRTKLSFMILRACLMCVRGSRSHSTSCNVSAPADYGHAVADARISN